MRELRAEVADPQKEPFDRATEALSEDARHALWRALQMQGWVTIKHQGDCAEILVDERAAFRYTLTLTGVEWPNPGPIS